MNLGYRTSCLGFRAFRAAYLPCKPEAATRKDSEAWSFKSRRTLTRTLPSAGKVMTMPWIRRWAPRSVASTSRQLCGAWGLCGVGMFRLGTAGCCERRFVCLDSSDRFVPWLLFWPSILTFVFVHLFLSQTLTLSFSVSVFRAVPPTLPVLPVCFDEFGVFRLRLFRISWWIPTFRLCACWSCQMWSGRFGFNIRWSLRGVPIPGSGVI